MLRLGISGLLSWVALLPVISDLPYDGAGVPLAWAVSLAQLWWRRLSQARYAPLLALLPGLWIGASRWASGSFADAFGEALGLGVAVLLVWVIARTLDRLEERSPHPEVQPAHVDSVFREVCRARRYDRPLALLALRVPTGRPGGAAGTAEIAALLREATREPDLVTEHGGHLLAAFPEIGTREIPALTARIEKLVSERLGLALRIGSASFQDDAITYDALIRHSFEALDSDPLAPGLRRAGEGGTHRRTPDRARVA